MVVVFSTKNFKFSCRQLCSQEQRIEKYMFSEKKSLNLRLVILSVKSHWLISDLIFINVISSNAVLQRFSQKVS